MLPLRIFQFIIMIAATSSLLGLLPDVGHCQELRQKGPTQIVPDGHSKNDTLKEYPHSNNSNRNHSEVEDSKPLWPDDDSEANLIDDNEAHVRHDSSDNVTKGKDNRNQVNAPSHQPSADFDSPNSPKSNESDEEWKLDLAKKEYAREPNDASLSELLSAYAELINSDCFAGRKSSCPRLIEESIKLDPFFTPAICAQHGSESKLCSESYGSLSLGRIEDSRSSISRKLTLNLDEGRQSEILKPMQERRWSLISQFNQNQTQQGLADILKMFFKELALVCNREQFLVESVRKIKEEPSPANDPLTTLLLATPTPTPIPGGLSRSRRITKECWDLADEALSFAPDFSSAVCAKFGRYSPRCNQSLKNARIQREGIKQVAPPSNSSEGQSNLSENDEISEKRPDISEPSHSDTQAPLSGGLEEF